MALDPSSGSQVLTSNQVPTQELVAVGSLSCSPTNFSTAIALRAVPFRSIPPSRKWDSILAIMYLWLGSLKPPTASVEVSDTNGIDSGILLGADSSFNGNASFERYSRTYEEVLSLVSSESDHATLEVADICDVDDSLGDIPLPTSSEIYFSTRHYELRELFQKAQSYMVHAREREYRVKAIKGKVDDLEE
ncbi:hypothetical protein GH714_007405 [Hevea brasiliensis]|uniref:Uncharacterized protein n=1 Tax=Hevea brasiliensis TaxID=3981 RepID=A0A6A6N2R7_HEVBR|nr:hypothetical protein GH714_007405 [Hevea brasiliensis]